MKIKNTTYTPIECDLYDQLEIWATKGVALHISHRCIDGSIRHLNGRIITINTLDKEEFIVLASSIEIRLDRLIKIENIAFDSGRTCNISTD